MPYEDFTSGWWENDSTGVLSQTPTRSTFTNILRTTNDTYLFKDFGAGFWNDFDIEFELYISAAQSTVTSVYRVNVIAFSEYSLGDYVSMNGSNEMIYIVMGNSSNNVTVRSGQRNGMGGGTTGAPISISLGTLYYCRLFASGSTVTLQLFSDPARTVQVGSDSTLTRASSNTYQYLMVPQALDYSGSYTSTGYIQNLDLGLYTDVTKDLFAKFYVPPEDNEDLKAVFIVAQDSADLPAEFLLRQETEDLKAIFLVPYRASQDLYAEFETNLHNGSTDLMAKTGIRRIYDLSNSGGIGFYWEGVGKGHVDFIMHSPTGAWTGKFPDYANWTWVALTWDDLQEVDIDGTRPDKSQITGLLWTVHSAGQRHLDGIYGLPKGGDRDVFSEFVVRHSGYKDLPAEFFYNHFREDLYAKTMIRQSQPGRNPQSGGLAVLGETSPYNYGSGSYHVYSVQNPWGRKSFDALGRHWVFYAEGELLNDNIRRLAFISQGNGWTTKTYVSGITNLYGQFTLRGNWAVHFDGIYIHLTYYDGTGNGTLQYRRGTPYQDGSIIWETLQTVTSGVRYGYLNISVDVNGYPFIAYSRNTGNWTGAWVINSSTNDGTWVTDVNYEHDSSNRESNAMLFPLANTMLLLTMDDGSNDMAEYLWDGAAWNKTVLPDLSRDYWTAAIDVNDVLHFGYYDSNNNKLQYKKRAADGTWTTIEDLVTGLTELTCALVTVGYDQDQGDVIIFYSQGAVLYYLRYHEGAWLAPEILATLPNDVYNILLSTPEKYTGGRLVFYAQTEENAPYTGTLYAVNLRIFNAPILKAEFTLRQLTGDLKGVFELRQGTEDLKAIVTIRHSASEDLKAATVIRHADTKDLYAKFLLA